MVTNTRPNRDIRRAAAFSGICLWQIADSLGITDANFSRKLRRELPADEKEKSCRLSKISAERMARNEQHHHAAHHAAS